jgi:hypothetical protein
MKAWFREGSPSQYCKGILSELNVAAPFRATPIPGNLKPICNQALPWSNVSADSGKAGGGQSTAISVTATATAIAASPETPTAKANATGPKTAGKTSNSKALLDACTGKVVVGTNATDPRPSYSLCLGSRVRAQLFLRSAYGVYEFLGEMVAKQSKVFLYTGLEPDPSLLTVTHDFNSCFVRTSFEGENYCVPTSAYNTKRIFTLLRQLVALNTAVQNPTPTPTVRTTP